MGDPTKPHPTAGSAEDPRAPEGAFLCVVPAADPRTLSLSPSSSAYGGKLWPFIHARRAGKGTGSKGHSSPIRGGEKKKKTGKAAL